MFSYAIEPNEDHSGSVERSDSLTRTFFTAALKQRIQAGSNTLLTITPDSGWLGNNDSLTVFSYGAYPGKKEDASWLMNEEVAKEWLKYQK